MFFAVEKLHSEEEMQKALVQKIDLISLLPVCNSYSHIYRYIFNVEKRDLLVVNTNFSQLVSAIGRFQGHLF